MQDAGELDDWDAVCSQLSEMSVADNRFDSVLVDFGGIALYQCDAKEPVKSPISKKVFSAWKLIANASHQREVNFLLQIIEFDNFKLRKVFMAFKSKAMERRHNQMAYVMKIWTLLATSKRKERERLQENARKLTHYWRNTAMEHAFLKKIGKIVKRKYLAQWKKQFAILSLLPRVQMRADRVRKRRYLRIWRLKCRVHKRKAAAVKVRELRVNIMLASSFDHWRVLYLQQICRIPKEKMMLRAAFIRWRIAQAKEHKIKESHKEISESRRDKLMRRAFVKWTRKLRLNQRKKQKRILGKWARFVVREVKFSVLQCRSSLILMQKVFREMKFVLERRNREVKRDYFAAWELFVMRQKQDRECQNVVRSFALSRTFGRWKMLFERNEESREIAYVRSRVVEVQLKRRMFRTWLDRAIESFKRAQITAIRFRKRKLKQKFFQNWHRHCRMLDTRALESRRTSLLRRAFTGFLDICKEKPAEKATIAEVFHSEVLKRRYFDRLRMIADQKHVPTDDDLDDVIAFLNNKVTFGKMTRGPSNMKGMC